MKHMYPLDSYRPLYNPVRDNGVIIPVLQMRKLRVRGVKGVTRSSTSKWQSQRTQSYSVN